jgi:hypothetical protein
MVNAYKAMTGLEGTMMSLIFSMAQPTRTSVRRRIRRPKARGRETWRPEDSDCQQNKPEPGSENQLVRPEKHHVGKQPTQERPNTHEGVKSVKVNQHQNGEHGTKEHRHETVKQQRSKEMEEISKRSWSNGDRNMPGGRIGNEEQVGLSIRL